MRTVTEREKERVKHMEKECDKDVQREREREKEKPTAQVFDISLQIFLSLSVLGYLAISIFQFSC